MDLREERRAEDAVERDRPPAAIWGFRGEGSYNAAGLRPTGGPKPTHSPFFLARGVWIAPLQVF